MGHVVPDFQTLCDKGLGGMTEELKKYEQAARATGDGAKASFFLSARHSVRGVQDYLGNWATLAREAHDRATVGADQDNMQEVAARLQRLVT